MSLSAVASDMEDDPLIGKVMINQFEKQFTDGSDPIVLEAQGWLGKDLHKLWIKIDTAFFLGESDRTALRFKTEYEVLFTQRIIMTPEIEINGLVKMMSRPV